MDASQKKAAPAASLETILTAIAEKSRWQLLSELVKGEPLPVVELAKRTEIPAGSVSKHMALLFKAGIVERGYGRLYRIAQRYLVAGERSIDLGPVLLRLGRPERK